MSSVTNQQSIGESLWAGIAGKTEAERDERIKNIFDLAKILIAAYCAKKCADEFSVMSLRNPIQLLSSWVMVLPWGVCTFLLLKWSYEFFLRNDPTEIVPVAKKKWDAWVSPVWSAAMRALKANEMVNKKSDIDDSANNG
ncbi:MAG: hypothetical protein SNF33_00635 [Candidatus Algichlamydia australiensis]|nr:hypothetical protein [Chlamydiales bacterium]